MYLEKLLTHNKKLMLSVAQHFLRKQAVYFVVILYQH